MNLVYISVGSNLGDRVKNCSKSIKKINEQKEICLLDCSSFYLTSPTDYENQNWFVNLVIKIRTFLSPYDLLNKLISIQYSFNKKEKSFRFGPRFLDLDIIFYESSIISLPYLEVPHPRMHKRLFVLKPFCEINPEFIHPVLNVSIESILDNWDNDCQTVLPIDIFNKIAIEQGML